MLETNLQRDSADMDSVPIADARDLRLKIPVLGLREYWYPAIKDRSVGWRKPVHIKMLGQDICLFRGKSGKVVAIDNACPHRGASYSKTVAA